MLHILLVEDDIDLAATIVDYLELEDIVCDHAANGVAGLNLINANYYDVLVLDINMPRMDGLQVCQTSRSQGKDMPILMLTARDTLEDKMAGFGAGADDYLVKPFAMQELIVRVKTLAKRRSGQVSVFKVADLTLDLNTQQAKRNGRVLKLSPISFKLLEVLVRASPSPVSRQQLLKAVWGEEQPDTNNLKVHIFNLRKILELEGEENLLQTVSGVGFVLRPKGPL